VRIDGVESWRERIPLREPYTIASETFADVDLLFVRIVAGARVGHGSASPAPEVTGETVEAAAVAVEAMASRLHGDEIASARDLLAALPDVDDAIAGPAARAALDMALWDLLAKERGLPLIDLLGRAVAPLPTSVTLGIQPLEDAVRAARERVAEGFRALKVKLGRDVGADVERLASIRAAVGPGIALRTDPNMGYDSAALRRFLDDTRALGLELCEQPVPRGRDDQIALAMRGLDATAPPFVADESLHDLADARALVANARSPYAAWNLKLMKCGGVTPARTIAALAASHDIGLMWGCNDESRLSIAGALHVALASPATRWLDLDGSFDLSRDPARGGFELVDGCLRTLDAPGLGVELD